MALLLMPVNWGIEARKWQFLVKSIQPVAFSKAYKAIFVGQAIAFNAPNRIGESAGRAVYLEEGNRLRGVALSVIGSMSQNMITLVMGFAALIYLRLHLLGKGYLLEGIPAAWVNGFIVAMALILALFIPAYFRLSWLVKWLEKIPFIARHRFFVQKLEDLDGKQLLQLLGLSAARYLVFVVQYMLLLAVFEVHVAWTDAAALVGVLFLVLAVVPTIALAELGFRGKLSIELFGLLSPNALGIIATATGIWIINLIVPAIIGTLFILGIRFFRNK